MSTSLDKYVRRKDLGGWVGRKNLFGGEWVGRKNPFTERIEKPVHNIGPPLTVLHKLPLVAVLSITGQ